MLTLFWEKRGKTPSFLLANLSGGNQMCWDLPSSDIHMQINTSILSGCLSLVCGSITASYTWILPAVITTILCYRTGKMGTSEPPVQYPGAEDGVEALKLFGPGGQEAMLCSQEWWGSHKAAQLLPELLFPSPFCFPTTLCTLTVCLCFLLPTLRSEWEAKGLRPIKCGSRWQPGGIMGRRAEISSILKDLLSLHWDHTYKTGAAAPYVSEKVTLSKFYLATEESFSFFFSFGSLRYQNPRETLGCLCKKRQKHNVYWWILQLNLCAMKFSLLLLFFL